MSSASPEAAADSLDRPVLQVLSVPTKTGTSVKDVNSSAGNLARELSLHLLDQAGCHAVYVGHEVEHPGIFRLFCEWASNAHHALFTKTEYAYSRRQAALFRTHASCG